MEKASPSADRAFEGNEPVQFSIFSKSQKRLITFSASFAAMFSGLNSFIYYPALVPLATDLKIPIELINLTLTTYLVVAGIAPSLIGDLADHSGRRPVYMFTFAVYFAANVGLALQRSYAALLVLRMVQSAGSSGTITIVYGVIADVATSDERGSYVGVLMGFTNASPCVGPLIGGALSQYAGWPWVFWFLSILSGVFLLGIVLFFPETAREVVGNGSIAPHRLSKTFWSFLREKFHSEEKFGTPGRDKRETHFPNPITCLRVLADLNSLLIIVVGGVYYAVFSVLGASLSTILLKQYKLSYLVGGLAYLPAGAGGIIAALCTGKLLDRDYRVIDRDFKERERETDQAAASLKFPFEQARLRSSWYFMAVNILAVIGYGWAVDSKIYLAVSLILQFLTGGTMVAMFTICGTLLTDLNIERASTAQAAYNIVRCAIAAGLVAVLEPLANSIGVGWCFSFYASLCAMASCLCWLLQFRGVKWRSSMNSKRARRTMI